MDYYKYILIIVFMVVLINVCLLVFKKKIYNTLCDNSTYKQIEDNVPYPEDFSNKNIIRYVLKLLDEFNIEILEKTQEYSSFYIFYDNIKIIKLIKDKNNILWVLIRGTHTYNEFEQDLKIMQTKMYENYCHSGFSSIYSNIKDKFIRTILYLNPKYIYCIGHSLGGGVLSVAALDLINTFDNISIYIVGSPRACDINYTRAVSKSSNIYNIINLSDIYAHIIPATIPFANITYDSIGNIIIFNDNQGDIKINHSLRTYYKNVSKYTFVK